MGITRLCAAGGRRGCRERWALICMRTDRCAGAREGCGLFVCLFAGRLRSYNRRILGVDLGGGGEQDWDSLAFCFSLENVVPPPLFFFLIRLGSLFSGGWAAAEELRSAQGSGPSSAPGGTGRGAGGGGALRPPRWVPGSAPDACGRLSHPARLQLALTARDAPRAWGRRTVSSPADPRERPDYPAQTPSPAPRDARTVPGPGTPLLAAAAARGWGSCPSLPRVRALGRRGRAGRSLLAFPPTTLGGAFVFPLSGEAVHLLPALAPEPGPRGHLAFRPGSFCFSLDRLPSSLPSGSPGKVASPSLPKSSPGLRGGGWERSV